MHYRLTNGPFPAYMYRMGPSKVVHPSCSSTYRNGGRAIVASSPSRGTSKWGAELVYSRKASTIAPFSDIPVLTEIANRYALRVRTGKRCLGQSRHECRRTALTASQVTV